MTNKGMKEILERKLIFLSDMLEVCEEEHIESITRSMLMIYETLNNGQVTEIRTAIDGNIIADFIKGGKIKMDKLKNISTKELVEELIKREGVYAQEVKPHTADEFLIEGPATVLTVID